MEPQSNAYQYTPNTNVPLNNRLPGELADIALEQLKPFQIAADAWPVHEVYRDHRDCNVCLICDQNIWFSTDMLGYEYHLTEDNKRTLKVAHIRQVHSGVVDGKETATRTEMPLQSMPKQGSKD